MHPHKSMQPTTATRHYFSQPNVVKHYTRVAEEGIYPFETRLLASCGLEIPGCRGLDVGCGPGRLGIALNQRGGTMIGMDIAPAMLFANSCLGTPRGTSFLPLVAADASCMPFRRSSFDLLLATHNFLGHLTTQDQRIAFFKEAARVLHPEGSLLISCHLQDRNVHGPSVDCTYWIQEPFAPEATLPFYFFSQETLHKEFSLAQLRLVACHPIQTLSQPGEIVPWHPSTHFFHLQVAATDSKPGYQR
ncbi:MAG: methyltransferase domain-containing protein [Magnetococcales bacterium]|nr:methyltransferase domain-containing protein [Magnetococcales bacterium]